MRVLVVEDEEIVARRLVRLVAEILGQQPTAIRRAPSLEDGLAHVVKTPVDLLFLDLNLHGRDGFAVLEIAAASSFQTIVVSAQHDQALRAFEYGVTDFVPKPYTRGRLRQAIERARGRAATLERKTRRLVVRASGGVVPIEIDQVVRIQGADDYSELHCADGSRHLHQKTLAALERILPERYARIHRSHIVDTDRIARYETAPGSRYFAVLEGEEKIPVSRAWYRRLKER